MRQNKHIKTKEHLPYEVYLMYSSNIDAYKIGVSRNSHKRVKQLQTGCPYKIEVISTYKTYRPFKVEATLHNRLLKYKLNYDGEPLSGEWLQLSISEVINFLTICSEIEKNLEFLVDNGNPFV